MGKQEERTGQPLRVHRRRPAACLAAALADAPESLPKNLGREGEERRKGMLKRERRKEKGETEEEKRGGKGLSAIAQQTAAALCSAKGAGGGFGQPAPALDWLKGGNMRERKFIMAGKRKVYLTVLEEYFLDGVLDCGNRDGFKCGKPACEKGGEEREPGDGGGGVGGKASYPAVMRYSAGYTLAQDFFIVAENQENAADPQKIKVDNSAKVADVPEFNLRRYQGAVQAVPREYWPVVRLVCINDVDIYGEDATAKLPSHRYSPQRLCRGLDALAAFYEKFNAMCRKRLDKGKKAE